LTAFQCTTVEATKGAETDPSKSQQIYDWVVTNTYREPKVLRRRRHPDHAGNRQLSGKCADLECDLVCAASRRHSGIATCMASGWCRQLGYSGNCRATLPA
jgi:hypothetical protein